MLEYHLPDLGADEFEARWPQLLPWLADLCTCEGPFLLKLKVQLQLELVSEFCHRYLLHDLRWRDTAVWYDHVVTDGVHLLPRLPAYFAALFILSNVVRYEPEYLDDATLQGTDMGYFLGSFLENAERFVPQLVLELLEKRGVFFE